MEKKLIEAREKSLSIRANGFARKQKEKVKGNPVYQPGQENERMLIVAQGVSNSLRGKKIMFQGGLLQVQRIRLNEYLDIRVKEGSELVNGEW